MSFDEALFHSMNQAGSDPVLDVLMVAVSLLALTYVIILIGPLLWHWKHRELALDAVVLVLVTGVIVYLLKLLLMRERPFEVLTEVNILTGPLASAGGPSMPSGHTARAFALGTFLFLSERCRWRPLAIGLAIMVGVSRIYLGVHWPSDVLAGARLGIALGAVMYWAGKEDNAYTRTRSKMIARMRRPTGA